MGVSENSVPLNPMVNDHYPILSLLNGYLFGNIPYFQTNPNGNLVKVSVVTFSVKVSPSKTSSINFVQLNMVGPRNLKQKHKRLGVSPSLLDPDIHYMYRFAPIWLARPTTVSDFLEPKSPTHSHPQDRRWNFPF